jgi:hypothetical protein
MLLVCLLQISEHEIEKKWRSYSPVVKIFCLPERIVAGVECASIGVELVRKDQLHLAAGVKGGDGVCLGRGFEVDESQAKVSDRR